MALASSRTAVRSRPFGGVRPRPVVARAPARRTSLVVRAGLFDFLAPKQQAQGVPQRARELSEALIDVCSSTKVGSSASPAAKEEISELVAELQQYSVKNPVRSPLLWGTYDVLYCSKPTAVGGPLKKGAGPVLAPGQSARQILQEPGTLINEVSFKTLGFLPGFSRQYGTIQPVSGDTFVLSITEGEINAGLGSQQKQFDINRKIQILYLDDTLRIVRFLPSELADDEAEAAEGEEEEILFVFQRVAEQEEEEEEEVVEEEEEEEERPASPIAALFGGSGTRKVESLATQVERKVEAARTRKGTQPFFVGGRASQEEEGEKEDPRLAQRRERERQQAEAQARKQREADERRAAAEKAKAEAAAAKEAEARARAAQEARERAEQEKAERAARAAAIREQLAELAEELKEKQAAAREAAKEVREVARENQATLKQVAAAEAAIAEAEGDVQQVSAALDEAAQARKAAEQALKDALAAVKDAEAAYKQAGAR